MEIHFCKIPIFQIMDIGLTLSRLEYIKCPKHLVGEKWCKGESQ